MTSLLFRNRRERGAARYAGNCIALSLAWLLSNTTLIGIGQHRVVFRTMIPAPATLQEHWDQALVVARVRALTRSTRAVQNSPTSDALPHSENAVLLVQVFKGTEELQGRGQITVIAARGEMQGPGGEVVELRSGAPILDQGEQAVLFLGRSPTLNAYQVMNTAGYFRIDGDLVEVPSAAKRYVEFGGQETIPLGRLMEVLRSLAR